MTPDRPNEETPRNHPETGRREEESIQLIRETARFYLTLPHVSSVGVGYKIKDGIETDQLAIQFTVTRKFSPNQLAAMGLEMLPAFFVNQNGTRIATDVLERSYKTYEPATAHPVLPARLGAGQTVATQQRRIRRNPIRPGISVSHVDLSFGTLGAIVHDVQTGAPYLLSNWHVLRGPAGRLNDQIVQPSAHDHGNVLGNLVGRLIRSHLGEAGDCAIASIVGRGVDPSVLGRGTIPRRVREARIGDRVVKSGRATGVTFGQVNRTGVLVKMNYGPGFNNVAIGGFEIRPNPAKPAPSGEISKPGDSGSLWMLDANGPDQELVLGLHFAGELALDSSQEHALACHFSQVQDALGITLVNPRA
jgi:endonuclease G, mitochondrial